VNAEINDRLSALRRALEERAGSGEKPSPLRGLTPDQYRKVTGKCPPGWQYAFNKGGCYRVNPTAASRFDEAAKTFTRAQARKIGDELGVDWKKVDLEQFRMGLGVEAEHDDDGKLDVVKKVTDLGKIALAHLKELPDYYTRLKDMERGEQGIDNCSRSLILMP
jgi:hypothetical protein